MCIVLKIQSPETKTLTKKKKKTVKHYIFIVLLPLFVRESGESRLDTLVWYDAREVEKEWKAQICILYLLYAVCNVLYTCMLV